MRSKIISIIIIACTLFLAIIVNTFVINTRVVHITTKDITTKDITNAKTLWMKNCRFTESTCLLYWDESSSLRSIYIEMIKKGTL